jgi:uncharacterized membrane protein
MILRAFILAIAALASPAGANTSIQQVNTAKVEWVAAHCDPAILDGNDLFWMMMVINGTDPEVMAQAREEARSQIADDFPTRAEACEALTAWVRGE